MKNKKNKLILITIILVAILLRLVYVIKMPYAENQHDLDGVENAGHLNYIYTVYKTGWIPQDNSGQHYHPPLHHLIAGYFLKGMSIFTKDYNTLFESLQFLSLAYSIITLFIMYKILKELKIEDNFKLILMFIFGLFPNLIIMSGSLNNDELSILLIMLSILYLIKWYKQQSAKNLIILALSTGLAVMTKTSGAIIAIPILYVFLLQFYKEIKNAKDKKFVLKKYFYTYLLFGSISLTIGLWYPIRNLIRFGQPILYVLDPKNISYSGDKSYFERFMPFANSEFSQIYCKPFHDINFPVYITKCSLFGEYRWAISMFFMRVYYIAVTINIVCILSILLFNIKNIFIKVKEININKNIMLLLFWFNIASFIAMNLKLPYACSMDFRYIVPALYSGAIGVYYGLYNLSNKNRKAYNVISNIFFVIYATTIVCANICIFGGIK